MSSVQLPPAPTLDPPRAGGQALAGLPRPSPPRSFTRPPPLRAILDLPPREASPGLDPRSSIRLHRESAIRLRPSPRSSSLDPLPPDLEPRASSLEPRAASSGGGPGDGEASPDLWDRSSLLLLRWRDPSEPPADAPVEPRAREEQLLAAAAEALQVEHGRLAAQATFPSHRLLLFRYTAGPADGSRLPAHVLWKAATLSPKGRLGSLVDNDFPAALNVTLCMDMAREHVVFEGAAVDEPKSANAKLPDDFITIVGPSAEAHAAYMAGCRWWRVKTAGSDSK